MFIWTITKPPIQTTDRHTKIRYTVQTGQCQLVGKKCWWSQIIAHCFMCTHVNMFLHVHCAYICSIACAYYAYAHRICLSYGIEQDVIRCIVNSSLGTQQQSKQSRSILRVAGLPRRQRTTANSIIRHTQFTTLTTLIGAHRPDLPQLLGAHTPGLPPFPGAHSSDLPH